MENVIQQWDNAAAAYAEDQEISEYAESNKTVIKSEPVSYDGITKNNDLPLFFFAEFIKK